MFASTTVAYRQNRLFVIARFSPGGRSFVDDKPIFEADPNDVAAIGNAVLAGLSHYRPSGEMPNWATFRAPILDYVGLSTFNEYERGLRESRVDRTDDGFKVWSEEPHELLPANATPEELGTAVRRAVRLR